MTTALSEFTTDPFSLDSFLFQKRRFLDRDSGFEWSHFLFSKDPLTKLDFRLQKETGGRVMLHFKHTAASEDAEKRTSEYPVALEHTSCRHGRRAWFICPYISSDGEPCERRCRHLYLSRRQERFVCRLCAGLQYPRNQRNHSPIYMEFVRPMQVLQGAALAFLTCSAPKKKRLLQDRADAARKKIAEFAKRWHRIAARVVTGKDGVRDKRYFDELANLLCPQIRDFTEDHDESVNGRRELMESAHSEEFLKAACDPRRLKLLALVAVMTHRISRHHRQHSEEDYERHAIDCIARREYAESIAQDPAEVMKLFSFLNNRILSVVKRTSELTADLQTQLLEATKA